MKTKLKKLSIIALSIGALLPLSFAQISDANAKSLDFNNKQNQSLNNYPINHQNVRNNNVIASYLNECEIGVIEQGFSEIEASQICSCTLDELSNENSITLGAFSSFKNKASDQNSEEYDILYDAGMNCAMELLYE